MYNTASPNFILRHGEASHAGAAVILYWYCFRVFFPLLCCSSPDWECQRGAHHSLGEVSKGTDRGCQGENFASFGLDFRVRGLENTAPSLKKSLQKCLQKIEAHILQKILGRKLYRAQLISSLWVTEVWPSEPSTPEGPFWYFVTSLFCACSWIIQR